jgi:hypothetical protein
MATPIWPIEGVAIDSTGDMVPDSLAAKISAIDGAAVDGLGGTHDSLAYRVAEIENHIHSDMRWFAVATAPDGELHVADRVGDGSAAFQIDAGNNTWGSWVQILGSDDTPAVVGMAYFDFSKVIVEDTERANAYFIQFSRGTSGAAGLSANMYTEFVIASSPTVDHSIVILQSRRAAAGTKVWARCMCPGQDTATVDFYFGIHEYEG